MTLIMPWRVQLLGDLRISRADQSIQGFRNVKSGELFADLAMHSARNHPREEIVERYWPDAEPSAGRLNLRVTLSFLRRRLEPPGTPQGSVLLSVGNAIRLNPAVISLDVDEFKAAVLEARGDPGRHVDRLEEAVRLYAGELLPGCRAEWVEAEREELAGMFLEALSSLARTLMERGNPEAAIGYALRMVTADPVHEPGHLLLMRFYAQTGQAPRALEQYAKLRRLLKRRLGMAPSDEAKQLAKALRAKPESFVSPPSAGRLSREILSRPDGTARPLASENASPETASAGDGADGETEGETHETLPGPQAMSRLPRPTTRFFGRDGELARIDALLTEQGHRLVTLTGPGGSGKTRLAAECAARRHAAQGGATWFVPLADVADAALLPQAVLDALDIRTDDVQDPVRQVAESLSSAPALLVLDNFEQLVEQGASFVLGLLERTLGLSCLVTSRRHLDVPGERILEVLPLPLPKPGDTLERLAGRDSVRLFVDRAQAKAPEFQVTERNQEAVSDLVRGLEGIPLALEMAAVWIRVHTPARMAAELADRYQLLDRNLKGVPDRHKSLEAAVAWSYGLLSPEATRFLARLSAFRGGWISEAAEAVCLAPELQEPELQEPGMPGMFAPALLAELSEHSWITGSDEGDGMRFRMLKTLQEFAERQMSPEQREDIRRRHARYYWQFIQEAKRHLDGPEQQAWVARVAAEWDNLSAAVDWHLANDESPERVLRLASNLCRFCEIRGYPAEGRAFLEAALAKTGEAPAAVRGPALNNAGWLAFVQGDHGAAKARFEEALAAAAEAADREDEAIALGNLGLVAEAEGRYDEAASCFGRSGDLAREIGAGLFEANARGNLANLLRSRGRFEEACAQYQECVGLFQGLGNARSEAIVWVNLGGAFCRAGKFTEARESVGRALGICHKLEDQWLLAASFECLSSILAADGRLEESVRFLAVAARLRREAGIPVGAAEREAFEREIAMQRQKLGVAVFQRCWQDGEEEGLDTAVGRALEEAA